MTEPRWERDGDYIFGLVPEPWGPSTAEINAFTIRVTRDNRSLIDYDVTPVVNLIAAAPDLLEAAKAALEWMPDGPAEFVRLLRAYNKSEGGVPEAYALDDWKERKSAVVKKLWEATRAAAEGVE